MGALRLSITNTVLYFVLLPTALVVLVAALSLLGGGAERRKRRYRPGRPYDFSPIWFLAAPERVRPDVPGASGSPSQSRAITSGVAETGGRTLMGATGGASDRW